MLVPASAIGLVVYSSAGYVRWEDALALASGARRARAARDADGPAHEAAAAEALLRRGASRRWVTARRRPREDGGWARAWQRVGLGSLSKTLYRR